MCVDNNHLNILVLKTPGKDHKIYWCEDCDKILGTSEDFSKIFSESKEGEDKFPEKKESNVYYINKRIDAIL
ncbi:MAG: hypothetical protein ACQESP_05995 [Candidatus Muiribacteriota bacterium]